MRLLLIAVLFGHVCRASELNDPLNELRVNDGIWKLAGADAFSDGGSYCISFLSQTGRILHLFILPDSARIDGKLIFELRRFYDDPNGVTIQKSDGTQESVLWLLNNYQERPEIKIEKAFIDRVSRALQDPKGPYPTLPQIQ